MLNERAYTLPQAIDLYENRVHQQKMENLAKEQLRAQKRQLELLEQQQREKEKEEQEKEEAYEKDGSGSGLGTALLVGGLAVAAISLFKGKD